MIALLYFLFFIVYLLVSLFVIRIAYRFAKRRYQKGWVGGLVAALVMYHLVFWDWIPVLLMHKYYCETQAGFWVYKSPRTWVKEHPEVLDQDWNNQNNWRTETLNKSFESPVRRYWRSPSIYREVSQNLNWIHAIHRREEKIVDAKTGQELSKAIEFYRGYRGFGLGLTGLKIWLGAGKRTCGPDRDAGFMRDFSNYLDELRSAQITGESQ